eukprot:scaffold7044_cov90-Skeletonema_dohrnii-CCMP3373.AAC.2
MAASLCWWRPWGRSRRKTRVGISTTVPKVNHLYVHNRIGIGTTVPKVARNEKIPCREVRKRNISHQFRHSMHYLCIDMASIISPYESDNDSSDEVGCLVGYNIPSFLMQQRMS